MDETSASIYGVTRKKTTPKLKPGRVSLFRDKIRGRPLTVLLTKQHWDVLDATARRLVLSRADVVALLIHKYARKVEPPDVFNDTANDDE